MKTLSILLALSSAQMVWAGSSCTTHQVDGTYAFLANGSVLVPATPLEGPFMRIGSFTADGRGGLVFTTLAIYNGFDFGSEHFTGTYSVTSDCAIDLNVAVPAPINGNVEFKGWVADDGDNVTFMLVNAATVPPLSTVVGFGRARSVNRCSTETLSGAWRLELNGFKNLGSPAPGTPYRHVSQIQADGRGGFLASFISSDTVGGQSGVISLATAAGTYTVGSDCTFDLNYSIGGAPYSVRGSLISSSEAFASLNMPGPTQSGVIVTGTVATGTMVRRTAARRHD